MAVVAGEAGEVAPDRVLARVLSRASADFHASMGRSRPYHTTLIVQLEDGWLQVDGNQGKCDKLSKMLAVSGKKLSNSD